MSGPSPTPPTLSDRLGLGPTTARDDRLAARCLAVLLAVYVVSFACFYPSVAVNDDEALYLWQVQLILDGRSTEEYIEPFTGEVNEVFPSTYAPGTALTMAPFARLLGWRGAYLVPLLGLLLAVTVTARWLADEDRPPIFALVILGFAPTLVMGRVAMSDVPSMGLVALGLWLFWRGLDRGRGWWLAAGFVAGLSFAFRTANPLVFVPLFAGTVLRREWRCWALVVGGLAGVGVRLATMAWFFGDPFFERSWYAIDGGSLVDRLAYYAIGLLVLVPGGLLFALLYRGRRRPEVIATFVLFVGFYVSQSFSSSTTSTAKRLILTLRYVLPLLPLLAFAMAESMPRLLRAWQDRSSPAGRQRIQRVTGAALILALAGVGIGSAAVHPAFHAWGSSQAAIRDEIHAHVPTDAVLVTNRPATRKFTGELGRRFKTVRRSHIEPSDVTVLAQRHAEVYLVLLDRTDSEIWRENAEGNRAFVEGLEVPAELLTDRRMSPTDRLRIWRIRLQGQRNASTR